jgi:hypothetical protein
MILAFSVYVNKSLLLFDFYTLSNHYSLVICFEAPNHWGMAEPELKIVLFY